MATKGRLVVSLLTAALASGALLGAAPQALTGGRLPLEARKADQLLDRANFVFVGTVVQNRASNLSSVANSSQTTLVRVDRVLHGTPWLADMVGQVITVRSLRTADHQAGQASTFFLDVDAFGENVSGIEIGRFTQQAGDEDRHGKLVAEARGVRNDRELNRRLKMAEQVVQGRVVSVEPAEIEERISDPLPQQAPMSDPRRALSSAAVPTAGRRADARAPCESA